MATIGIAGRVEDGAAEDCAARWRLDWPHHDAERRAVATAAAAQIYRNERG